MTRLQLVKVNCEYLRIVLLINQNCYLTRKKFVATQSSGQSWSVICDKIFKKKLSLVSNLRQYERTWESFIGRKTCCIKTLHVLKWATVILKWNGNQLFSRLKVNCMCSLLQSHTTLNRMTGTVKAVNSGNKTVVVVMQICCSQFTICNVQWSMLGSLSFVHTLYKRVVTGGWDCIVWHDHTD